MAKKAKLTDLKMSELLELMESYTLLYEHYDNFIKANTGLYNGITPSSDIYHDAVKKRSEIVKFREKLIDAIEVNAFKIIKDYQ